jgi:hypothetical protein
MKKLLAILLLLSINSFGQDKDTIYILFHNKFSEMEVVDYTNLMQAGSSEEKLNKSITYLIEQMEEPGGYDYKFKFSHHNQSQKAYKKFGGKPPAILHKPKSYLKCKKVLNIDYFRTTPYIEVAKTFEKEDSWEQDVMIFIVDVAEIKNDSIILREVTFTRPVKQ